MYLNIEHYIESEYGQEKLLEAINVLKYCENELDRKIRLASEDRERIVTKQVTKKVTNQVTEEFACNLLRAGSDVDFVHEMTGLPISKINELKANL